MYPEVILNLVESFKALPGIGTKTAERYAFAVLELEEEQIKLFSETLKNIKSKITNCKTCNVLCENDKCMICNDDSRSNILCVVEDSKSVFLFEKMGLFNGKYHVLDNLISPINGVDLNNLGMDKLLDRIKLEKFDEIIFAFKPSIEGETTALYIKRILEDLNIKFTYIASGVPIGADMEYIDTMTLERAINDRKEI